jgi:hypothetical protein
MRRLLGCATGECCLGPQSAFKAIFSKQTLRCYFSGECGQLRVSMSLISRWVCEDRAPGSLLAFSVHRGPSACLGRTRQDSWCVHWTVAMPPLAVLINNPVDKRQPSVARLALACGRPRPTCDPMRHPVLRRDEAAKADAHSRVLVRGGAQGSSGTTHQAPTNNRALLTL